MHQCCSHEMNTISRSPASHLMRAGKTNVTVDAQREEEVRPQITKEILFYKFHTAYQSTAYSTVSI